MCWIVQDVLHQRSARGRAAGLNVVPMSCACSMPEVDELPRLLHLMPTLSRGTAGAGDHPHPSREAGERVTSPAFDAGAAPSAWNPEGPRCRWCSLLTEIAAAAFTGFVDLLAELRPVSAKLCAARDWSQGPSRVLEARKPCRTRWRAFNTMAYRSLPESSAGEAVLSAIPSHDPARRSPPVPAGELL